MKAFLYDSHEKRCAKIGLANVERYVSTLSRFRRCFAVSGR